jgi:ParB family chromosome partitioning protein
MTKVRQAWADRLPDNPEALFAELLTLPLQELLSLLAVCVASTVSVLASHEEEVPAAALARAVNLDMHDWWTPTAAGYFEHVSKAKALEAVQAFAPDQVNRLGKLKKAEIASEAERLAVGTGWLPVMFRGQDAAVAAEAETRVVPESEVRAEAVGRGSIEAVAKEGEHATA